MSISFDKPKETTTAAPTMTVEATSAATDIVPVEQYDIVADRSQMEKQLVGTEEIEKLTQLIKVDDMNTIVTFGADVATEISKASDVVLNSMSMAQLNESSRLMTELTKIMSQFDIDEIKDDPKGLAKLFSNAKKQLDKILAKYDTMGKHVDNIFIELRKNEDEIKKSNKNLANMFDANVKFYHELVKYILAGEQLDGELTDYIKSLEDEQAKTGDNSISFQIQSMQQAQQMLQQRVQDLRIAENVAMQSIPMLKMMEFSNYNLVRKINSAFIITLPVFKQALAQAMMLKRQKVMAESQKALDDKTNELLLKNAQNTVAMSKQTAMLASGSSIKIETLEQSWQTIMQGIEDTKAIEAEARKKREEDKGRLEVIKKDFESKYAMPNK
jgi:uncharacterized protein YaaN involved in tellurite resistance